jgi:SAM-dependent methyltransferase
MRHEIFNHLTASSDWQIDEGGVLKAKVKRGDGISFPSLVFESAPLEELGNGWWSTHRNLVLMKSLKKYNIKEILEVGAGNGGVAKFLDSKGIDVACLEPHLTGARQIASSGILSICGFLDELHLPDNTIHSIGFFDVLEHIEDPTELLSEAYRVLSENSLIFVMVPAHQFLYSNFDKQIGHFRRYSKSRLKSELEEAGFEILESRSMFITLLPIVIFQRLFVRIMSGRKVKSKSAFAENTSVTLNPNRYLNFCLLCLISWERLLNAGKFLPGVSIIMIAQKK